MAYEKNEIEEVVSIVTLSDFTELRITKIGKDGVVTAVDIRQWYCTTSDPEMKPTKKGIRLKVESIGSLIDTLEKFRV